MMRVVSRRAERPKQRTFTAEYKSKIVSEYDAAEPGEKGALCCVGRACTPRMWWSGAGPATPARCAARRGSAAGRFAQPRAGQEGGAAARQRAAAARAGQDQGCTRCCGKTHAGRSGDRPGGHRAGRAHLYPAGWPAGSRSMRLAGDWRWVRRLLDGSGLHLICPDLPSHRMYSAGLAEDAAEVRAAIRSSTGPVVVVGWSYGGSVISLAATGGIGVPSGLRRGHPQCSRLAGRRPWLGRRRSAHPCRLPITRSRYSSEVQQPLRCTMGPRSSADVRPCATMGPMLPLCKQGSPSQFPSQLSIFADVRPRSVKDPRRKHVGGRSQTGLLGVGKRAH